MRWLGRLALEAKNVTIADLQEAAEMLGHLRVVPAQAMDELLSYAWRVG